MLIVVVDFDFFISYSLRPESATKVYWHIHVSMDAERPINMFPRRAWEQEEQSMGTRRAEHGNKKIEPIF